MDLDLLQTVKNKINICNLLKVSLVAYLTSRRNLCYHIQSLAQKCSSGLDTDVAQILPIDATFSQVMLKLSGRTWKMDKISEYHFSLGLYLFKFWTVKFKWYYQCTASVIPETWSPSWKVRVRPRRVKESEEEVGSYKHWLQQAGRQTLEEWGWGRGSAYCPCIKYKKEVAAAPIGFFISTLSTTVNNVCSPVTEKSPGFVSLAWKA